MAEQQPDHEQYAEYQASLRPRRAGLLTALVLATFDMGLSPVGQVVKGELGRRAEAKAQPVPAEALQDSPRVIRARKLADVASDAELGYAQAA